MTTVIRLDEHRVPGKPLGRHIEHDDRSRRFAFAPDVTTTSGLVTTVHKVRVPVLDQGQVGACTGFATEACTGTDPFYSAIPDAVKARPTLNADADNEQALALYSAATKLDSIRGAYPPDDTGSTGLAAAKAAQQAGLISGYRHCFSLEAALTALTVSPIITGVNWYEGMDNPDSSGLVKVTGQVRGGHEFCLFGIDVEHRLVLARNSWSESWGVQGCFAIGWDDYGRLLSEQGDATVMVPLTQPAPIPVPTPAEQADQQMAAAVASFETAAAAWRTAKGL